MSETEAPFRPREKLIEKQRVFQSIHRHTYLKGPYDKITSVAIPLALAGASLYMIVTYTLFHTLKHPYLYPSYHVTSKDSNYKNVSRPGNL